MFSFISAIFGKATNTMLDFLTSDLKRDVENLEINKIEAQDSSLFVKGWRPFTGWVCAFSLLYQLVSFAIPYFRHIDAEIFNSILLGMLGLSGIRTVEKLKKK